ncbi:hypothetical protein FACS1894176_11540 [Bacteroidia bacterium]|nr:hypothetical protein FACS1894176_11540 [Bacteroidia bacterium]
MYESGEFLFRRIIVMARPKKENADYFSHDKEMRNNPKLKYIRNIFNLEGYAVFCMLLEYLTNCE